MQIESGSRVSDASPNGQADPSAAPTIGGVVQAGVSREFHNLFTDIEDLVKSTTSLTGDDLARAKAKLSARVAAARESLGKMGVVIADRARNTATATDGYVHERPWQAIGIGAALGLVAGYMLARRR